MSLTPDFLMTNATIVYVGLGVAALALLVAINKRLKSVLVQTTQVKLLNHPDFDHREGAFVAPEE